MLCLLGCSKATNDDRPPRDTSEDSVTVDCTYEWGCWAFDQEVVASSSPNSVLTFREDPVAGYVTANLDLRTAQRCSGNGASAPIEPERLCGSNIGFTQSFMAWHDEGTTLPDLSDLPTEWEIDLLLLECLGYQHRSELLNYRSIPTTATVHITPVDNRRVHFDLRSLEGIDRAPGEDSRTLTITTDVQICDYAGVTPFRAP